MGISAEEVAYATDLFSGLGEITTRRMMGGLCLYHQGTIFAIVHFELGMMIKGKGAFISELEDMGCTQWVHERADSGRSAMPYWTLPDGVEDDPDAACDLARRALAHL